MKHRLIQLPKGKDNLGDQQVKKVDKSNVVKTLFFTFSIISKSFLKTYPENFPLMKKPKTVKNEKFNFLIICYKF